MKRVFGIFTGVALVGAIAFSPLLFGKGHVPSHKGQVCHQGQTITVSLNAIQAHLDHDDCQLPTNDGAHIFHTGDLCNSNNAGGSCTF